MIEVGSGELKVEDFSKVLFENEEISFSKEAEQNVNESFSFLQNFLVDKVIYGINTGFGPMAKFKIEDADKTQLQYNLIRSHSSGGGDEIDPLNVKAIMLARLNSLLQGFSGIDPNALRTLKDLINKDIYPLIFAHGGVGASGDLVQLAHLALGLIGEGESIYKGQKVNTADAMKQEGVTPMKVAIREGLAIMNGTSAMSGVGIVNLIRSKQLLSYSILTSCIINEIVGSYDDHFSEGLNRVKKHKGQNDIAKAMRDVLEDSERTRSREKELYAKKKEDGEMDDKVQEYYSIRCVPQILGPVLSAIEVCEERLQDEVNSANDNPIIDAKAGQVFHGGNFHGDYVSHEMDRLKAVMVKLSMLMERQMNYLFNSKLNEILTPFVNKGKLGFNFGMQGVQFTAVSTVAENQTLAFPMCIHSIPNNNDNQDIVSMGCNAAIMTQKVIDNSFEVLAIYSMGLVQAVDLLGIEDKMSSATKKFLQDVKTIAPAFVEDTPKYKTVAELKKFLLNNRPNIF